MQVKGLVHDGLEAPSVEAGRGFGRAFGLQAREPAPASGLTPGDGVVARTQALGTRHNAVVRR